VNEHLTSNEPRGRRRRPVATAAASRVGVAATVFAAATAALPTSAHASFLPPELMDKAAFGIAWFVLIVMPIVGIVLFWMVHVLPEKIAHKRHHPQIDAIKTLCLLSLVFGGLLWPLAWLWAYVKPVTYKLAYGTEKHDDYFHHMGEKARAGQLDQFELEHLRQELDAMAERGSLSSELGKLRGDLAAAKPAADSAAAQSPPAAAGARAGSV
jgi:CBS domain containing-hemolysin-like protein